MRSSAERRLRRPVVGRLRCNSHRCHEFAMLIGRYALPNAVHCRGSLQSALRFNAWLHWKWCQTGHLQGGSRFPARPRYEDGRWLCTLLIGSDLEAWRDWQRVLPRSPSELREVIPREGRVSPHTDPERKRKPQCYARLVRGVSLRGLVSFWEPSEATVGVLCGPRRE